MASIVRGLSTREDAMSSPPPPASPRRRTRLFLMDEHMRAMREAASTQQRSVRPEQNGHRHVNSSVPDSRSHSSKKKRSDGEKSTSKEAAMSYASQRAEPAHKQSHSVDAVAVVRASGPSTDAKGLHSQTEREGLMDQIQALDAQLELLRLKAGLPTQTAKHALQATRDRNAAMDESVHNSQRLVRQLHATTSHQLQQPPANPLRTHIHLPRDKLQRCALLQALKGVKLRRAAEDGIARFRDLQDSLSYMREERFTTDDGTYHCNRFEVIAFPQFKTARQMYDALLFWWHSLEISVTEMIDHVSLREDNDDLGPTIWNQRLITVVPEVGCVEEVNNVGFAQFFESYDLMNGGPLGIIVQNTVDVDDLYPYKPLERTRKDVQVYYLFSEYVDPVTKTTSVVMKTGLFNGQLAPQFPIEPRVIAKLHENMSKWQEYTVHYLNNFVVPP